MALSPEAFQEVETTTSMLSGLSSIASKLSRAVLSVLFFIRFGILLLGCKTVWLDEEKDFLCNSTRLLCAPSCFDEFSPISSFNLFSLQMVALLTHSLCVVCFTRPAFQAHDGWLQARLRSKRVQLKLHTLGLVSRTLIEVLFILTYYKVTEGFVHQSSIRCHTTLCEKSVICTDAKSSMKNVFSLCLCAASAASAAVCLWELVAGAPFMLYTSSAPATKASGKKPPRF